ncbi:E2 ubiquitin-conjugating enzyme [Thamnocephalis sphaerospora]|uniref:NEDD8-conjugating enzyme UBC12 n=1 Tax=Thamnocephalis sphaerospora TaxID=78915 RepID=A0A4V1IWY0_9FUNG|nr:E2 ubiquitin-conjugating enzyme [Thamnocephalis sphaerospora]|eukprot:RKP09129.1 E2 ubiquitin-conjugating enzyme [Thamnocephalis sphaerospora]
MIKIWTMKKEAAEADKKKPKQSAAQIRVQKDMDELSDLPKTIDMSFPNPEDLLHFELSITPDEGIYMGGRFFFTFSIDASYPHKAPRVQCKQKIYHPNIDLEGNVCLNILREDWKPVLNLHAVIVGLQFLFLEPNADDPLNKEAAQDLRENRERFKMHVAESMRGGRVNHESFDCVLAA